MYGLIGKMIAAPGRRDELIAILVGATGAMPGCRSYIVARDVADRTSHRGDGMSEGFLPVHAAAEDDRPAIVEDKKDLAEEFASR
jgi:hypothetical protein